MLIREDVDASDLVAARFRREGIDVRLNHTAKRIELIAGEEVLIVEDGQRELRIPFDALLVAVAVARNANLKGYGLEELGVITRRTVEVNAYLQTNLPNIYAAVNTLFDPFSEFRADYRVIPWATFVDPEVARVGLNELEAKEREVASEVTVYHLDDPDRAIADGEAHGFVKVLAVPGRDRILGATIVGEHAGDLLAEFVLAMKHGIGLNKILGTIHTYPTPAEANKFVAGNWKRDHAPHKLLAWVERFHARRRG